MTIIKGSTKRGQDLLARANNYEGRYLDDVYGRYSTEKARAYRWCNVRRMDFNGSDMRIISANTFQFSVAFDGEYEYVDPKTGEVTLEEVTVIETANNEFVVLNNK